mmetsp:Transcript_27756/g.42518  ORF Transcript_27756/g.42518 Transcript_27756/m.42518 type:complete len:232 (-) Transcript_27756:958-1653(-)
MSLLSRSVFAIAFSFELLTFKRRAIQMIVISLSFDTATGRLLIRSSRVSSAASFKSWIFFFPSIRNLRLHSLGSNTSGSSSESSSSVSTSSASSNNFKRATSSCFFLKAVAIALRFISIHLSMVSLATMIGATLTNVLPLPRINPFLTLSLLVTKPTLLRIAKAGGNCPTRASIILFSRFTFRNLRSNGSRMTLESNDRMTLAVSSASDISPLTSTSSCNLSFVLTWSLSL